MRAERGELFVSSDAGEVAIGGLRGERIVVGAEDARWLVHTALPAALAELDAEPTVSAEVERADGQMAIS